jgi:hypothetical protein
VLACAVGACVCSWCLRVFLVLACVLGAWPAVSTVLNCCSHPRIRMCGIHDAHSCSEDLSADIAAATQDTGPGKDEFVLRNFAVASAGRLDEESIFQNISLQLSVRDDPDGVLEVILRPLCQLCLTC